MRLRVVMGALRFGAYLQFLAARPPRENTVSLQERLASFPAKETPVEKRVEIRWNRHQVPFIEARTDRSAGFAVRSRQAMPKYPLLNGGKSPLNGHSTRMANVQGLCGKPALCPRFSPPQSPIGQSPLHW